MSHETHIEPKPITLENRQFLVGIARHKKVHVEHCTSLGMLIDTMAVAVKRDDSWLGGPVEGLRVYEIEVSHPSGAIILTPREHPITNL